MVAGAGEGVRAGVLVADHGLQLGVDFLGGGGEAPPRGLGADELSVHQVVHHLGGEPGHLILDHAQALLGVLAQEVVAAGAGGGVGCIASCWACSYSDMSTFWR